MWRVRCKVCVGDFDVAADAMLNRLPRNELRDQEQVILKCPRCQTQRAYIPDELSAVGQMVLVGDAAA